MEKALNEIGKLRNEMKIGFIEVENQMKSGFERVDGGLKKPTSNCKKPTSK